MKYVIYMDVFFVVNLIMDFILLKVTAHFVKPQTTYRRCLLGGSIGSLITCLSLLVSYKNMVVHMLVCYIFTAAAMTTVTFGKSSGRIFVKRVTWLYSITIFLGGIMNLIYDYTYFGYLIHSILSTVCVNSINLMKLIIYSAIAYVVIRIMFNLIMRCKTETKYVTVRLVLKGKSVTVQALIDSGNSLREPYGGKLVHIVEYNVVQGILEGVDIHKEKYRLVPFHSLGQRNGLIEVIDMDEMMVCSYGEECENNGHYTEKCPAIGIYHGSLSSEKRYQMLLHGDVNNDIFT